MTSSVGRTDETSDNREGSEERAPSSSRTRVGPYGFSTERRIRTLDPREASIEATRVDLFASPPPPPAPPALIDDDEPVPPSYRTRLGLYYLPQEPATEPELELGDVFDTIVQPAPRPTWWQRVVAFFRIRN